MVAVRDLRWLMMVLMIAILSELNPWVILTWESECLWEWRKKATVLKWGVATLADYVASAWSHEIEVKQVVTVRNLTIQRKTAEPSVVASMPPGPQNLIDFWLVHQMRRPAYSSSVANDCP